MIIFLPRLYYMYLKAKSVHNIVIQYPLKIIFHCLMVDLWCDICSCKFSRFSRCGYVSTIVWLHHMEFNEALGEKARHELYKNAMCCFEQTLGATTHKTAAQCPFTTHITHTLSVMNKTRWELPRMNSKATFSDGLLPTDALALVD